MSVFVISVYRSSSIAIAGTRSLSASSVAISSLSFGIMSRQIIANKRVDFFDVPSWILWNFVAYRFILVIVGTIHGNQELPQIFWFVGWFLTLVCSSSRTSLAATL
jgi:hypothetical protein